MRNADTVRTTRSGDRFHYLWASLRALRLLDWTSQLELLSVEGPADDDLVPSEEVIDVAEYYGGVDAHSATEVVYHQLKHSSVRIDQPMTSSDLKKTVQKFAAIYRDAASAGRASRMRFSLVSNRSLATNVRRTLDDLASGDRPAHNVEATYLRYAMGFGADVDAERAFCGVFDVEDGTTGLLDVERVLAAELNSFVPGGGTGGELAQLMQHVSGLATYEAKSHTLARHDLLVILRSTERDLFPAMPKFEDVDPAVRTNDVGDVADLLRNGRTNKLLVTAHGGVGKSVFSTMLQEELAGTSLTLSFDCFAGGDYRQINTRRHNHRVALTQIANELASRGLCTALIPSTTADPGHYVDALLTKVSQACERLVRVDPDALLTLIVDAADNAAMAANEFGERHFIGDLFLADWPPNFRLVATCRPERSDRLRLPRGTPEYQLVGFDKRCSLLHLRTRFPDATDAEGGALHVLSSGNPRVQAMAMESAETAAEAIATLDIARDRPGSVLDTLLAAQVEKVASQGHLRDDELERLCQALATLHPTMPLADLAAITDVDVDAIRSFAVALGRGLHLKAETLQFRDEPTETWFRDNHKLDAVQMRDFAARITPLSGGSTYLATVLPQVYFEAGMLTELVDLALSNEGLPADADDLQSQEIARARARFALGAALKARRNEDAALLAIKAGTLSSGHSRRMKMLRTNPDMAARFLGPEVVDALCSGRDLAGDWPGSNLHVEATMLSHLEEFHGLAHTRVVSSYNTIGAILRLSGESRRQLQADIGSDEIGALALAITNIEGPAAGAKFLSHWRPKDFVRATAARFAATLADAGRTTELSELILADSTNKHIQVGVMETMFDYGIVPSDKATESVAAMLKKRRTPFGHLHGPYVNEADARAAVWTLLHALRLGHLSDSEAQRILNVHLAPLPSHVGDRWHGISPTSALCGHALRARLHGQQLTADDVIKPEFAKEVQKHSQLGDRNARTFLDNIPDLLPWAARLVDTVLDGPSAAAVDALRDLAATALTKVSGYDPPYVRINGVAEMHTRLLALLPDPSLLANFGHWLDGADAHLGRSRKTIIRCAARNTQLASLAIKVANRGLEIAQLDRTDADQRVDELIALSRAILATSTTEAQAMFNIADQEAELVGDDLPARWYALTNTARALDTGTETERAYRLLQIGETLDTDERSDVSQLAEPLFAMDPMSYHAAVSRQRDRRAIPFDRLLGPIFRSACQPDGRIGALAVHAFGPRVAWSSVTDQLAADRAENAQAVLADYTRFERRSGEVPDEYDSSRNWSIGGKRAKRSKHRKLLARSNFTSSDDWNACLKKVDWYDDKRRKVVERALNKSSSVLPETLAALAAADQAREADFVTAARFAASQHSTAGLRAAVDRFVTAFADRFTADFATRYYDRTELNEFASACNVPVSALLERGFVNLGDKAHTLEHREYFSLSSHIARTLPMDAAARVFDTLAELFDDLAPLDKAADGPYADVPPAPADMAQCLAGLIWAALGDIAGARRWEAAHAVLSLVKLGDTDALAHLARYADGTHDATPFSDQRFRPYTLHCKFWLLLALDRAASEDNAHLLAPFVEWLADVVDGPPHAANQVLAMQTLNTLAESTTLPSSTRVTEARRHRVLAEWEEISSWRERGERTDPFGGDTNPDPDSGGFPFFFDFQPYWASHLGRVFGATEQSIAQRALTIAESLTDYDDEAADPRRKAQLFQRDSSPDHRSWPAEEDFSFYSSVHSLLSVGAELAQSHKALKEPDSNDDEYTTWLNEFLPKRRDGRWLSDRRDSPPSPAPEQRIAASGAEQWRWSLQSTDFASRAGYGTSWITVSASYDTSFRESSEDVHISSALISHDLARSYLIARQTSPGGPSGARLPTVDDPDESDRKIDRPPHPYRLSAWLDTASFYEGIDRSDEVGRNLSFPPPRPGPTIIERFQLVPDADYRTWLAGNQVVFRSRVWDATEQRSRDRATGTKGKTLEIDQAQLAEILRALDRTLVIAVDIRRDTHTPSYRRKDDEDELRWLEWSSKVYLIDPEGRWTEY